MLFINFEKVSKDTIIDGSFISIKIMATLTKLKLLSYLNSGYKPTIYRREQEFPNMRKGWFVKMGSGQKSGEPLIRFNWYKPFSGWRYSSFHAYNRNGKPRVSQNWYVAIKGMIIQKLVG